MKKQKNIENEEQLIQQIKMATDKIRSLKEEQHHQMEIISKVCKLFLSYQKDLEKLDFGRKLIKEFIETVKGL